jgi:hypothetical protein
MFVSVGDLCLCLNLFDVVILICEICGVYDVCEGCLDVAHILELLAEKKQLQKKLAE